SARATRAATPSSTPRSASFSASSARPEIELTAVSRRDAESPESPPGCSTLGRCWSPRCRCCCFRPDRSFLQNADRRRTALAGSIGRAAPTASPITRAATPLLRTLSSAMNGERGGAHVGSSPLSRSVRTVDPNGLTGRAMLLAERRFLLDRRLQPPGGAAIVAEVGRHPQVAGRGGPGG